MPVGIAPAHGGASVMQGDRVVGTVTSGGYGHRVGKNIPYAFIDPDQSQEGCQLEIDISGQRVGAVVGAMGLYDNAMKRVKA